jgi:hypothetical protein
MLEIESSNEMCINVCFTFIENKLLLKTKYINLRLNEKKNKIKILTKNNFNFIC